ncbi:MAG TPA: DUF559 domain-containing protein [Candidatus Lustribacter sp.]|nr:DUF559 domain-containing protein [Candidatus Lustribacter sp.]
MFVHLAGQLSLVDQVVLGDSLVRRNAAALRDLRKFCSTYDGRAASAATAAATLVRCGVDSPMETRLRLLIVLAGLGEPTVDYRLHDEEGNLLYRVDLSFPQVRLAIEYDGAHHDEVGQHGRDLRRREDLEAAGWTFIVVVSKHFHDTPESVLARIHRAMKAAGLAVPTRLSERWRAHVFPRATVVTRPKSA